MKTGLVIVLLLALTCCSSARQEELPSNSPQDIANIFASEPEAARNIRFAAATEGVSAEAQGQPDPERDAADAEFGPQIDEITKNIKRIQASIKESEEIAHRLTEQKAELRALEEQKEHLEKEKEKKILEEKLQKQMKDLSEINRMSRSLRTKFSELKRTQELIKTRMSGTRSSLSQLEADDDVDADEVKENAVNIAAEVEDMNKSQSKILDRAQKKSSKAVKQTLKNANAAHDRERKALAKQAAAEARELKSA
jgi:DNA repair exonuclease SbcCD ATPase subunit